MGSEMCIRDRTRLHHHRLRQARLHHLLLRHRRYRLGLDEKYVIQVFRLLKAITDSDAGRVHYMIRVLGDCAISGDAQ